MESSLLIILSNLINEKKKDAQKNAANATIKNIVLGHEKTNEQTKETFDYLQKYDVVRLQHIRDNEPELYASLAKEYAKGVRYSS